MLERHKVRLGIKLPRPEGRPHGKKNGRPGRKVIISQRKRREKNCATRALDEDEKIEKWLKQLRT
jgi:hypothetical protein